MTKNISLLINQQLPEYVRENYPNIELFLKAYYQWMYENGYDHYDILKDNDIDRTIDEYLDWFHKEFLYSIPKNVLTNKRLLLKHSKDFFQSKGSELSFKFLFRILYNEEIEFYYPEKDIKFLSASKWIRKKYLIIEPIIPISDLNDIIGNIFHGNSSKTRVGTEEIILIINNEKPIYELYITKPIGTFVENEHLYYNNSPVATIKSDGVLLKDGYWKNKKSNLSSTNRFFDNNYYQFFSYVIKSGVPLSKYNKAINSLVHPSGTKLFSEFNMLINFDKTYNPITMNSISIQTNGVVQAIDNSYIYDNRNVFIGQVDKLKIIEFDDQKSIIIKDPLLIWGKNTSVQDQIILNDVTSIYPEQYNELTSLPSLYSARVKFPITTNSRIFYISGVSLFPTEIWYKYYYNNTNMAIEFNNNRSVFGDQINFGKFKGGDMVLNFEKNKGYK